MKGLQVDYDWWKFIVKSVGKFMNTMQKVHLKIPFRYREILITQNISLSYDANDSVFSKPKPDYLRS